MIAPYRLFIWVRVREGAWDSFQLTAFSNSVLDPDKSPEIRGHSGRIAFFANFIGINTLYLGEGNSW